MKAKPKSKSPLVFIGLGNPGKKYRKTRHNAGFAVLDHIAERYGLVFKKEFLKPVKTAAFETDERLVFLVKPLTYMNRSGDIMKWIIARVGADEGSMTIICDNMDLKPGRIRLKSGGSSAGHNGIKSIIENLGSPGFQRMYIGVGRPEKGESIVEHVLGEFYDEDLPAFGDSVTEAADALMKLAEKPAHLVMNEINKRNY